MKKASCRFSRCAENGVLCFPDPIFKDFAEDVLFFYPKLRTLLHTINRHFLE